MNHLTLRLMYLSLFFIGSSDNPNFVLVSNVFTGGGFNSTKRSMVISLPAKNKLGFVDGTIAPPLSTSSTYSNWFRANSMVISWLLNSVTKTIADSLLFLPTAKEIWQELHQRFEQFASALIYQMQRRILFLKVLMISLLPLLSSPNFGMKFVWYNLFLIALVVHLLQLTNSLKNNA